MVVSSERPSTGEQEKALAISAEDGSLMGLPTLFDIQILIDESALANSILAKQLIKTALLPTDKENKKD